VNNNSFFAIIPIFFLVYLMIAPPHHSPLCARRCKSTSESSLDSFFWLRANRCTSCQNLKLKTENVKSENPSRRPKTKTRQRRRIRGWAAAVNAKPPTRHPRVDIIVFPAPICDSWFPSPGCSCLPACRRRCDVLWVSLAALLLAVHPPARCNDIFLNGSLTALRLCGFFFAGSV